MARGISRRPLDYDGTMIAQSSHPVFYSNLSPFFPPLKSGIAQRRRQMTDRAPNRASVVKSYRTRLGAAWGGSWGVGVGGELVRMVLGVLGLGLGLPPAARLPGSRELAGW